MYPSYLTPLRLTLAATLGSVAISLIVTWLVLHGSSSTATGYILATAIPAVLAPAGTLPLSLLLQRMRRMGDELERLARTDPLTELPNRRAFFERAEVILAPPDAAVPVAALMIDVDRFKAVNDEFGHAGGDLLLTAIGRAIDSAVTEAGAPRSAMARLGGEEFAVLVSGLAPTAVARLADRICAIGRQTRVTMSGVDIASTVSVGVAMRSGRAGIDALLKLADDAVYLAKRGGRDRWAFAGSGQAVSGEPGQTRAPGLRRSERMPAGMAPAAASPPSLTAS